MCLRDCIRDHEKELSQDESFHSNWAPRRKGKCLVVPENTVHIYVLFGILSVVQPVFLFKAHVLICDQCLDVYCLQPVCKGWVWGGAPGILELPARL